MKLLGTTILAILLSVGVMAQTDSTKVWKTGGAGTFTFSQVSLTNWAAGGENSLSVAGIVSLYAKYKKDKSTWDNTLDIGYGLLKQGEAGFIKSDDKIDFSSKFGRQASNSWYYTALFNFKSQMTDGFNYPNDSVVISKFLAPGYMLYSLGMDYKPTDDFTLFLSPLTGKTTLVMDQTLADAGSFGVEAATYDDSGNVLTAGQKIRNEIGGYLKASYKTDLITNVALETKIDLFSNYIENPGNIDVNWETLIVMKVNKFLTANLSTTLIYDDDVDILVDEETGKKGPRTQFKEVFGIGLSYKF